jgi:putative holliday junction resolvase
MKYLGIDFGSKRVGVAVSDDTGRLAFPYVVLQNLSGKIGNEKLLNDVMEIIEKEKIEAVVMGESKNFQNEPNKIMGAVLEFKKNLEKVLEKNLEDLPVQAGKTKIKVFLEPEFLTSAQAEHIQGKTEMHDASAAAIILQTFLDKQMVHLGNCGLV